MDKLEHDIKKAYSENDKKTTLSAKDSIWERLEISMHSRKGVAAFWRVAAVFLAFILASGVFASIKLNEKQNRKIEQQTRDYELLATSFDSLQASLAETIPEVRIIENEKVVYRDRIVYKDVIENNNEWEQKYLTLKDSMNDELLDQKNNYQAELKKLRNEIDLTQKELADLIAQNSTDLSQQTKPFKLKSEKAELDVSKSPTVKNPDFKVKILQTDFGNKNNLNTTIFKK